MLGCWRRLPAPSLRELPRERVRRPPGVRRGRPHRSYAELLEPGARRPRAATSRSGSSPATGSCSGRPNSIDWAVAALAVSYAGGVLVPVNSRYTGPRGRPTSSTARGAHAGRRRTTGSSAADQVARAGRRGGVDATGRSTLADVGRVPGDRRLTLGEPSTRAADAVSPRRRRRHPVHLRHHRPLQGRDERAPADHRRRPGLGRAGRGRGRTTATWWSTRSSTPSATRSASSSGCCTGATLYPVATFDVDATMRLIEEERITVLPGAPDDLPVAAQRARTAPTTTCRRCGSRSPAPPSCRSC